MAPRQAEAAALKDELAKQRVEASQRVGALEVDYGTLQQTLEQERAMAAALQEQLSSEVGSNEHGIQLLQEQLRILVLHGLAPQEGGCHTQLRQGGHAHEVQGLHTSAHEATAAPYTPPYLNHAAR